MVLLGRQSPQILVGRNLDVDAQTVGVEARLVHQFGTRPRDTLHMNVAVETMHGPQLANHPDHPLHRVVGVTQHAGTEKQALDVVAAVEPDRQIDQLADRERGLADVVAAAVDAIGAIVDAMVRQHDLEQRNATPVGRERMAYAPPRRASHAPFSVTAGHAARSAGNVVLGRLGQHGELIQNTAFHTRQRKAFRRDFPLRTRTFSSEKIGRKDKRNTVRRIHFP